MIKYLRIDLHDMTIRQTAKEPTTPQQLDDADAIWLRIMGTKVEEWDVGWSEVKS